MILIVQQINILNIISIVFLKIFFKKIYFFKSSQLIRNKVFFNFLSKLKIYWVTYENFPVRNHTKIKKSSIKFSKNLCDNFVEKIYNKNLEIIQINKNELKILLNNMLLEISEEYFEYIKFAEEYFNNNDLKVFFLCKRNFVTKNILKNYNFQNINIFDLSIINFFIEKILKKLISKKETITFSHESKKNYINVTDFDRFSYAFFPHKGVHDNYFLKDYYYSKKSENLNSKKILHIEWSMEEINKISREYYQKEEINVIQWNKLKYKYKLSDYLYFKDIFLFFIKTSIKFGVNLSLLLFLELAKIYNSKLKLKKFKNLKSIFVGNEFLFPSYLNIAIRKLNIKIFTLREKTILSFYGRLSDYTKYFTVCRDKLPNSLFVGNPRLQNYFKKKDEFEKMRTLKKADKVCLVLDNKSDLDWYKNGRFLRANWLLNLKFYNDIILLADRNPEILFLLKCKNLYWLNIPNFKKIVEKINLAKNIDILDNTKWDSNKCLGYCDFAVGKYTSLMEEFVTIGKPIIIFDDDLFPAEYIDINKEIFAKNLSELNEKFYKMKTNQQHYNNLVESWKKKLDGKFIQENFEKVLIKNIDDDGKRY